jgi:O-acetyl-ADP-ribose deacetylase (regulator of RNase III)
MQLKRKKGNLVSMIHGRRFDVVVHGCNCQNVMGAGIAKAFKDEWPGVFEADTLATKQWRNPIAKLGNFSSYSNRERGFIIINAYTQLGYGRNRDNFEYESFNLILRKLEVLDHSGLVRFGFPYIGMGLAGGDPDRIIPMIEDFATRHDTTLVEYEQ